MLPAAATDIFALYYFLNKKGWIILSTSLDFIPLLPSGSGGVLKNTLKGIQPMFRL